jgi:thiol-disulfide isomerase/thioredoxin
VVLLAGAACQYPTSPPPTDQERQQELRLQAILINGGGSPAKNFQSHLLHVRQLLDLLLRSGVRRSNIAVFSADGADPEADLAVRDTQPEADFWMLRGTRVDRQLRTQIRYQNSEIEEITIKPATKTALRDWFERAARRLRPGDTLLLYVTDHGTKNKTDTSDNLITLWGKNEALSVTELRQLIELLDPGVRVVALMSQCFSGAFANLVYAGAPDGPPRGNVCGYFSSTAERPAYGCYPENRDKDNVGHSFRFIEALRMAPDFPDAHNRVLVTDRTPDVPLKTSDAYLRTMLDAAAKQRGQEPAELIDELLAEAWRDKASWEPEIRLLDRIGQAFGYFSPRSLVELQGQSKLLPDISNKFHSYGNAWRNALRDLGRQNLERFVASNRSWEDRLSDAAIATLDDDGRRALTGALLTDLVDYTRTDTQTGARLDLLKEKTEAATAARYRMQVRLGVVLRMEAVLTSIAGRVYAASYGTESERRAYAALRGCEALTLHGAPLGQERPVVRAPFPSYQEELELAETVLPGWMGIRFKQANPRLRAEYGLANGTVAVVLVYPDSPAQEAGLEVGDLILGPPDKPFSEPNQIREWVMTSTIGKPEPLLVLRRNDRLQLTLTPKPYPLKWPSLPGPPKIGSVAPALPELNPYRGTLPLTLTSGGPYLLFYWATWCAPCKASLPEIIAFEAERQTPAIAITDELPEQLDAFFKQYSGPFPEIVAVDEYRRSFLAYAVSGTPTFVLVDAAGRMQSYSTGYRPDKGIGITGWSWAGRNASSEGG